MQKLKIKTEDFINWFYFSGADQDQESELKSLGNRIAEQLCEGAVTITPQEILDGCEQTVIPMDIIYGLEDECGEIGDGCDDGIINDDFEVVLVSYQQQTHSLKQFLVKTGFDKGECYPTLNDVKASMERHNVFSKDLEADIIAYFKFDV